jgi:hypothetical protein
MLWLRTILFTILVPGTVLGLVPFALAAGTKGQRIDLGTAHLMGFILLLPGVAIIRRVLCCDFALAAPQIKIQHPKKMKLPPAMRSSVRVELLTEFA